MKLLPHEKFLLFGFIICFIAFMAVCLTSCGKFMTEPEWNDLITNHNNNPNDTIVTQPIVIPPDTCHQLIHLTDTAFVCLSVQFDVTPIIVGFHWYGNNNTTTFLTLDGLIDTYFPQYPHHTYYQNDVALCMFIEGTDNSNQFLGKIGVITTNQSMRIKNGNKYAIMTYGALTFDQECFEADRRLNMQFSTLSGTNFTQEQNDILTRKRNHFKDCKAPEKFVDFSGKPVSQNVRDSTHIVYHWEVRH